MNVIVWLEYQLAFYDVTVKYISHKDSPPLT